MKIKKLVTAGAAAALVLCGGAAAAPSSAEAAGCDWYVYKTVKNTTYWEYSSGNQVNGGFWQHPDANSLLKTNEPFNGRDRTRIKYEHAWGVWNNLSGHRGAKDFPYINRGAVDYLYCY